MQSFFLRLLLFCNAVCNRNQMIKQLVSNSGNFARNKISMGLRRQKGKQTEFSWLQTEQKDDGLYYFTSEFYYDLYGTRHERSQSGQQKPSQYMPLKAVPCWGQILVSGLFVLRVGSAHASWLPAKGSTTPGSHNVWQYITCGNNRLA